MNPTRRLILFLLAALSLLLLVPACQHQPPTAPASLLPADQLPGVGQPLPAVAGDDLNGLRRELPPTELQGPMILLVGFEQEAQFDADRWLFGLLQSETPAEILELPTISGVFGQLARGYIDRGMQRGIPAEDWASVVTLYGDDASRLRDFLGNPGGNNMCVLLLDQDGIVRWRHDRGFSAAKLLELDRAVRMGG